MATANQISVTKYISKEWTALILLPTVRAIAGMQTTSQWKSFTLINPPADCVTAVNVSVKDQLTLSSAVAIGSTIVSGCFVLQIRDHAHALTTPEQQLSLFVIPLICIVAWITGYPLGMLFDPFESVALYLASKCFLPGSLL